MVQASISSALDHRPFYSDRCLDHILRRDRARRWPTVERSHHGEAVQYLRLRQLALAVSRSRLTPKQARVLLMRFRGFTWREIGEAEGHSSQAALHVFRQAAAKVRRFWRTSPTRDLHLIYVAEVSRSRSGSRALE